MSSLNTSFAIAHDAASICQEFFRATGINCFSYSRVYRDGSRAELWSDPAALHHTFVEKKYIVGAYTPAYYAPSERYAILENKIDSFPFDVKENYVSQVRDQRHLFDHAYPFKIINKIDECCEYFLYYAPSLNRSIVGFYINNLDILENFAEFFKTAASGLIRQAAADRLVRAEELSVNLDRRLAVSLSAEQSSTPTLDKRLLTHRQSEIAQHVLAGRTAREIAQRLNLSPRTVETHIDNMKSRLGCVNRSEFIVRLSHLGMIAASAARSDP